MIIFLYVYKSKHDGKTTMTHPPFSQMIELNFQIDRIMQPIRFNK